jgi:hypothetical protein
MQMGTGSWALVWNKTTLLLRQLALNVFHRFPENFITTERIDPIINPGKVSGHVHSGGPRS